MTWAVDPATRQTQAGKDAMEFGQVFAVLLGEVQIGFRRRMHGHSTLGIEVPTGIFDSVGPGAEMVANHERMREFDNVEVP
ncbi:MAG: hypothetical protein A2V88_05875 [Elusimicrobia bacterium RBG_16_66_12]|nr:MAG: hypothetical protein A2V88_05875 [Elusimicrobia bacterium RBG_16_66_12]